MIPPKILKVYIPKSTSREKLNRPQGWKVAFEISTDEIPEGMEPTHRVINHWLDNKDNSLGGYVSFKTLKRNDVISIYSATLRGEAVVNVNRFGHAANYKITKDLKDFKDPLEEDEPLNIPMFRSGDTTTEGPRYWYHDLGNRQLSEDKGIDPYLIKEPDAFINKLPEGRSSDEVIWLSQQPLGEASIKIDGSKLDVSQMRLTGQSQGHAIYRGRIDPEAIEEG